VVKNTHTGKRMAIVGSETDAIFTELERQFGKIIPRAVVEAQRRFVKTGFYSIEEVSNEEEDNDAEEIPEEPTYIHTHKKNSK